LDARIVPAVFNVTTTADVLGGSHLSLRQAILNSNNTPGPNTIILTVPGTYQLTRFGNAHDGTNGALQIIDRSVTINGLGSGVTIIDGGGVDRVFDIERVLNIEGSFSVAFNSVTIQHGLAGNNSNVMGNSNASFKDGGGILGPQADLRLTNTVVADNQAERFGGGIYTDTGNVTITGGAVSGNTSFEGGGGLFTERGAVTATNATFADNTAGGSGGAIHINDFTSTGNLTLVGGLFTHNTAAGDGGAIADFSRSNRVSLLGTAVVDNTSFDSGGGLFVEAFNFTIDRGTVNDNSASGQGGGISTDNGQQSLSINNSMIAGNTADSEGGGIESDAAQAAFNGDSITNNFGLDGGGITFSGIQLTLAKSHVDGNRVKGSAGGLDMINQANGSSCLISDSTLNNNRAGNNEGGANVLCTTMTVSNSSISGNRAGNSEGGLAAFVTTATLTNVSVIGNAAGESYGGLFLPDTTLTMTGCNISNNRAGAGVGGLIANGTATISNTVIRGNRAGESVVGFGFNGTQLNLLGDTIANNSAAGNDGGVFVATTNGGTIGNTTIRGNRTAGDAGGIDVDVFGGTLTISGCCISDNHAGLDGGGLFDGGTSTVTLINDTIFGNTASVNGGGIAHERNNSQLNLQNVTIDGNAAARGGGVFSNTFLVLAHDSIIAGNRANANQGPDVVAVTSQGFNLIGIQDAANTAFVDGVSHDQVGSIANPKFARLGLLQNNGGATYSQQLLPGSPAIDHGDSVDAPATDQRGVARPRDGDGDGSKIIDIGAFEK
jgi:predicted outer membrane repeat protein